MIVIFADKELEEVFVIGKSKNYNQDIIKGFIKKVIILKNVMDENDLLKIKSLNFEKLYNYVKGDYSIRINEKRRIVFNINRDGELKIISIEELSNHYS